jgi:hypothetical protein
MFLGAYHFSGDPTALTAGYDTLREQLAGAIELNLCVVTPDGLTVYDACPSRAEFEAFSSSPQLAGAFAGAGLPVPTVELLGEVHAVLVADRVAVPGS